MSNDSDIQQNQEHLAQLGVDPALAALRPTVETLQRALVSGKYPPDVVAGFVDLFSRMRNDIQAGQSLAALLDSVLAGHYIQPGWQVRDVYQSERQIFNFILGSVREQLEPPDPGIPVPIVLLVMDAEQVEALTSGAAFDGYPNEVRDDFVALSEFLLACGIDNWQQSYGTSPQDWRPFQDTLASFGEIARRVLEQIEGYNRPLVPVYYRIEQVIPNRALLKKLRLYGCLVVMDTISMHHPAIQLGFRHSLLDAYPNTLVARIAPDTRVLEIEQRLLTFAQKSDALEFFQRFDIDLDARCTEAARQNDFLRWLLDKVPDVLPENERSTSGGRSLWFKP